MISIICPTRNESGNIRLLLKKINDYVKIKYEIIFVDDDSSDGTVEIIKKISKIVTLESLVVSKRKIYPQQLLLEYHLRNMIMSLL